MEIIGSAAMLFATLKATKLTAFGGWPCAYPPGSGMCCAESLAVGSSSEAAHEELCSQLDHIERLLSDMPLQPPSKEALEPTATSAETPPAPSTPPRRALATSNTTTATFSPLKCSISTPPVPDSPARTESPSPRLRLSAERLSNLSKCMEARSAELTQHIALAMAQLPYLHPQSPSPDLKGSATPARVSSELPMPVVCTQVANRASTEPQPATAEAEACLQPRAAGPYVEMLPENYNELVCKIRTTEARLQDAISSLTSAMRNFRLARMSPTPSSHARSLDPSPSHRCACSPELSLSSEAPPLMAEAIDELQEVSWTRLNPLYPASSQSVSPTSHSLSPTRRASTTISMRPVACPTSALSSPTGPTILPPNVPRSRSPSVASVDVPTLLPALHRGVPDAASPALASFRLRATSSARWSCCPTSQAAGVRSTLQDTPAAPHSLESTFQGKDGAHNPGVCSPLKGFSHLGTPAPESSLCTLDMCAPANGSRLLADAPVTQKSEESAPSSQAVHGSLSSQGSHPMPLASLYSSASRRAAQPQSFCSRPTQIAGQATGAVKMAQQAPRNSMPPAQSAQGFSFVCHTESRIPQGPAGSMRPPLPLTSSVLAPNTRLSKCMVAVDSTPSQTPQLSAQPPEEATLMLRQEHDASGTGNATSFYGYDGWRGSWASHDACKPPACWGEQPHANAACRERHASSRVAAFGMNTTGHGGSDVTIAGSASTHSANGVGTSFLRYWPLHALYLTPHAIIP
jgi:hypothetical protein